MSSYDREQAIQTQTQVIIQQQMGELILRCAALQSEIAILKQEIAALKVALEQTIAPPV